MEKRAIVLSGGGARGAYQIGVWKALRKLNIKYDIVTGTSAGALNALLMVQNNYFKAQLIWRNVTFDFLFEEQFPKNKEILKEKGNIYKQYLNQIFNKGGLKVVKLEKVINRIFKPKKFFNSRIDFGIIVYNLSKLKAENLTKKELTKDNLKDYVVASSSCFPFFQTKKIERQTFIDGGYADNLPINLAIDMGATEVIAVDLNTISFRHKIKDKAVKITYIRPRNIIVPFLIFDKQLSKKTIKFGYNDTMKIYGKLDGNLFTFKKNHLKDNIKEYGKIFIKATSDIVSFEKKESPLFNSIMKLTIFNKIINNQELPKIINNTIEFLGQAFALDESVVYDISKYNCNLISKINEIRPLEKKLIEQKIKDKEPLALNKGKYIIKYIYDKMLTKPYSIKEKRSLCAIACIFPKEFVATLYLLVINKEV